jgi:tetratricopeptide (TPR) repeat protein
LGVGVPDKVDNAGALYWTGVALQKQGDHEGADRAWKKLIDEGGGRRLSKYYQALALEALGQEKEGTDRMRRLADSPAQGEMGAMNYYVAGLAELHRQRSDQANVYFQKALEINPLFWQAQVEVNRVRSPVHTTDEDSSKTSSRPSQ